MTTLPTDSDTTDLSIATNSPISTTLPISSHPTSASNTTVPTTDMAATQGHMIIASNPESSPSRILGPAVGGVVGGLTVVSIIVAVVVIALLFTKRSQKGSLKVNDGKESVQGYNNAVYDGKQNTQTDE